MRMSEEIHTQQRAPPTVYRWWLLVQFERCFMNLEGNQDIEDFSMEGTKIRTQNCLL